MQAVGESKRGFHGCLHFVYLIYSSSLTLFTRFAQLILIHLRSQQKEVNSTNNHTEAVTLRAWAFLVLILGPIRSTGTVNHSHISASVFTLCCVPLSPHPSAPYSSLRIIRRKNTQPSVTQWTQVVVRSPFVPAFVHFLHSFTHKGFTSLLFPS